MNDKRKCPVCDGLMLGRRDRKYCSDACRYHANNEVKLKNQSGILAVNKTLRKNRSILKTLCPDGKATVRRSVLENLGFDVRVFTSLFVTSRRNVYYLSYDYGFSPILDKGVEKALIIGKQIYMDDWNPWRFVKGSSHGESGAEKYRL